MDPAICKLTVVCPRDLRAVLIDLLDTMDPPIAGYTVLEGSGHGPDVQLLSPAEQVVGAMATTLIVMVLARARVDDIKARILAACPRPQIAYWVEPVLDYGRLAQ